MKTKLILLTLLTITLFSCTEDDNSEPQNTTSPVACFTPNEQEFNINEEITFINCSQNTTSYEWNFGDGIKSFDESPSHTYSNTGNYSVQLISTNNVTSDTLVVTLRITNRTSDNGYNDTHAIIKEILFRAIEFYIDYVWSILEN